MTRAFNTALSALALVALAGNLQAQYDDYTVPQTIQHESTHLRVDPAIQGPRLGMNGISTGHCVEVYSVNFGSAAQRLGLEPGDRILRINGHAVGSVPELLHVLRDAVGHHGGQVSVLVDNVRARRGDFMAERYVTTRTYLDGYAQNHYPPLGPGNDDFFAPVPQPAILPTSQLSQSAF